MKVEIDSLTIYKPDGKKFLDILVEEGSTMRANLMNEECINVKFSTEVPYYIKRGYYVDIPSSKPSTPPRRYVISDTMYPNYNSTTGGYDYDIRFDAWYFVWKKYYFCYNPYYGAQQTSFNFTGKIEDHLSILFKCLVQCKNSDNSINIPSLFAVHHNGKVKYYSWGNGDSKVVFDGEEEKKDLYAASTSGEKERVHIQYDGQIEDVSLSLSKTVETESHVVGSIELTKLVTEENRHIEYADMNIIEALNAICAENAFDCEWWIDESNILHLGRCEFGNLEVWENQIELDNMSRSISADKYATRIIAFGSTKNIPQRYRKFLPLKVTSNTLNQKTKRITYNNQFWLDLDEPSEYEKGVCESTIEPKELLYVGTSNDSVDITNPSINVSGSINLYAEPGREQSGDVPVYNMTIELYIGDKEYGGIPFYHKSIDNPQGGSIIIKEKISAVLDAKELVNTSKRIYIYIKSVGYGSHIDDDWDCDGMIVFDPVIDVQNSFEITEVSSQVFKDANKTIVANQMKSNYRAGFLFNDTMLKKLSLDLVYGGDQTEIIGKAKKNITFVSGRRYTIKMRGAFYFDIDNPSIYSSPLGKIVFRLSNGLYSFNPYSFAELSQIRTSGLYPFEKVLSVKTISNVTGEDFVIDYSLNANKRVKMSLGENGAYCYFFISSDYYDDTKGETIHEKNVEAETYVYKIDADGKPISEKYPCVVSTTGDITATTSDIFSEGTLFCMDGIKTTDVKLSWFQDMYNNSTISSYTRRLMLPIDKCPRNYIDALSIKDEDGNTIQSEVVELVKVYDDIYPTKTIDLFASNAYWYEDVITDDDGKKLTVSKKRYAFYILRNDFDFSADYIPSGATLQCIFQTGLLAGITFSLEYAGNKRLSVGGETYDVQMYYIQNSTDFGVDMPNSTLVPLGKWFKDADDESYTAQGEADKIVIVNYSADEIDDLGLIEDAEQRLFKKAEADLLNLCEDTGTYDATLIASKAKEYIDSGFGMPRIGQMVDLVHNGWFDKTIKRNKKTEIAGFGFVFTIESSGKKRYCPDGGAWKPRKADVIGQSGIVTIWAKAYCTLSDEELQIFSIKARNKTKGGGYVYQRLPSVHGMSRVEMPYLKQEYDLGDEIEIAMAFTYEERTILINSTVVPRDSDKETEDDTTPTKPTSKVETSEVEFKIGSRETRVLGYEMPLDIRWDNPKYTLGETATYSRLKSIEKQLKEM